MSSVAVYIFSIFTTYTGKSMVADQTSEYFRGTTWVGTYSMWSITTSLTPHSVPVTWQHLCEYINENIGHVGIILEFLWKSTLYKEII